jgi:hypothetical protein
MLEVVRCFYGVMCFRNSCVELRVYRQYSTPRISGPLGAWSSRSCCAWVPSVKSYYTQQVQKLNNKHHSDKSQRVLSQHTALDMQTVSVHGGLTGILCADRCLLACCVSGIEKWQPYSPPVDMDKTECANSQCMAASADSQTHCSETYMLPKWQLVRMAKKS